MLICKFCNNPCEYKNIGFEHVRQYTCYYCSNNNLFVFYAASVSETEIMQAYIQLIMEYKNDKIIENFYQITIDYERNKTSLKFAKLTDTSYPATSYLDRHVYDSTLIFEIDDCDESVTPTNILEKIKLYTTYA